MSVSPPDPQNISSASPRLWINARIATFNPQLGGMGIIEDGVIAAEQGRISFIGRKSDLPAAFKSMEPIDCEGRWITPGLIDCHTHLVHAGNRAGEFEMRLNGASYEEIAKAGGGIVSSVSAMRKASPEELVSQSLPRLDALMAEGVTTIEIKSGYGLDRDNEMKSLRAARRLAELRPVAIRTTFLGAHALPPEAKGDREAYLNSVINDMLPAICDENLADAVDAFCEKIAFSPAEVARVFEAAKARKLPVKLHADQLSNLGGAALAASFSALSADHLEYTDAAGAAKMAESGTVAVILPAAFYFLRETKKPPVELFRAHGVPMAVATDNNPGTAPLTSLLLAANMAATLFSMTVEECLSGITINAAKALGLEAETGSLQVGKWADMAIWNIATPAELVYRMGFNPLHGRIFHGRPTAVVHPGA